MPLELRKTVLYDETTLIEGGRAAAVPLRQVAAIAVVRNPWAGRGFVDDLKPEIHDVAPQLGELLTRMIVDAVGSGDVVEGYGKAAVVGLDGEIEHASALIHTLRFGNHYREAVKAKSYLSFTNKRGGPGTSIQIPMMHKDDEGQRSHYITLEMQIEDAPRADEIVVVLGCADGGRLHPRIGNRYIDLEELAAEIPPQHRQAVERELGKLDLTVTTNFPTEVDRPLADASDRQGIGGPHARAVGSGTSAPTDDDGRGQPSAVSMT